MPGAPVAPWLRQKAESGAATPGNDFQPGKSRRERPVPQCFGGRLSGSNWVEGQPRHPGRNCSVENGRRISQVHDPGTMAPSPAEKAKRAEPGGEDGRARAGSVATRSPYVIEVSIFCGLHKRKAAFVRECNGAVKATSPDEPAWSGFPNATAPNYRYPAFPVPAHVPKREVKT